MFLRALVIFLVASSGTAWAQGTVRVVGEEATARSRPTLTADVMASPRAGAVLERLDKEGRWYWVLLERDVRGTQRAAWMREADLEIVGQETPRLPAEAVAPPEADPREADQREADLREADQREAESREEQQAARADDKRLKKAERDLEKARQALDRLAPPIVEEPATDPLP
jgi:hypothetical protein